MATSGAEGSVEPVVSSVNHIVLTVDDIDHAETVYSRLFGRTAPWHGDHAELAFNSVVFPFANVNLQLMGVRDGRQEMPGAEFVVDQLESHGEGLAALVFFTLDSEKAVDTLRERGIEVDDPIELYATDNVTGTVRRWKNVYLPASQTRGLHMVLTEVLSGETRLAVAPLSEGVDEKSAVSTLDHLVIRTCDPDAYIRLFRDRLGVRLALDQERPEWGVRQLFFRLDGVTLEVIQPLDPAKQPERDDFWGVAWKVPDVRAGVERMTHMGMQVSEVRKGRKPGTLVATVKSPTCHVPTLLIGPDPETD